MKALGFGLILLTVAACPVQAGHIFLTGQINTIDANNDGIGDSLKISRVNFNVAAGTIVEFDTLIWEELGFDWNGDGEITGFDMLLLLYDSDGNHLAGNDDRQRNTASLDQNGSISGKDSVLSFFFEEAGSYSLALGNIGYSHDHALAGFQPGTTFANNKHTHGSYGPWGLDIRWTGQVTDIDPIDDPQPVPTPEPGTLALLAMGGLGMFATGKKWRGGAAAAT